MTQKKGDPVQDWATDFDHTDPTYNRDVHAIWDDLRGRCPVAHTARFSGAWLPVTHEHVREIAYDTEHFSSVEVVVNTLRGKGEAPVGSTPPISSDPPFHRPARMLLTPFFAPKRIAELEPEIRAVCEARLDALGAVRPGDVLDAASLFAERIPVRVIGKMVGVPESDDDRLIGFVKAMLEEVGAPDEQQVATREALDAYLGELVEAHRRDPKENLISFLVGTELFGEPLSDRHIAGTVLLLLLAGIDTTWSAIGTSLHHLASTPTDLARLQAEPELMPTAIEELLRAFAPVTMARVVKKSHDFHGCPMKEGEWVLLPFPAVNRDPEVFPRADEVLLDREENRHAAFGLGMHRCLGSNLARLELRVALETFMARFPRFELADPDAVRWSLGQIRGPRELPVRILQVCC